MLEVSELGDKIGEKLLMLLNVRQRQELIKYLLSAEKQNGGSADNLCILSEIYGLQTEAGSMLTEIRMGDLILLPGVAAGTGGRTGGRTDCERI